MEGDEAVVERHHFEHAAVGQRTGWQVRTQTSGRVVDRDVGAGVLAAIGVGEEVAEGGVAAARAADWRRQEDAERHLLLRLRCLNRGRDASGHRLIRNDGCALVLRPDAAAARAFGVAAQCARIDAGAQIARREDAVFDDAPRRPIDDEIDAPERAAAHIRLDDGNARHFVRHA